MLDPHTITIIGLLVEVIGVGIIWRFGWPQPQLEGGVSLALEDLTPVEGGKTAGEVRDEVERRRATYSNRSRFGFAVLVFGLLLQAGAQVLEM